MWHWAGSVQWVFIAFLNKTKMIWKQCDWTKTVRLWAVNHNNNLKDLLGELQIEIINIWGQSIVNVFKKVQVQLKSRFHQLFYLGSGSVQLLVLKQHFNFLGISRKIVKDMSVAANVRLIALIWKLWNLKNIVLMFERKQEQITKMCKCSVSCHFDKKFRGILEGLAWISILIQFVKTLLILNENMFALACSNLIAFIRGRSSWISALVRIFLL